MIDYGEEVGDTYGESGRPMTPDGNDVDNVYVGDGLSKYGRARRKLAAVCQDGVGEVR